MPADAAAGGGGDDAAAAAPPAGPIVTVEQASEIMSIVFSRQVTHNQLREFLATSQLDPALVHQVLAVLEPRPAVQQQQQQSVQVVGGDVASAVRQAFFGQFDTVKQVRSKRRNRHWN